MDILKQIQVQQMKWYFMDWKKNPFSDDIFGDFFPLSFNTRLLLIHFLNWLLRTGFRDL